MKVEHPKRRAALGRWHALNAAAERSRTVSDARASLDFAAVSLPNTRAHKHAAALLAEIVGGQAAPSHQSEGSAP